VSQVEFYRLPDSQADSHPCWMQLDQSGQF